MNKCSLAPKYRTCTVCQTCTLFSPLSIPWQGYTDILKENSLLLVVLSFNSTKERHTDCKQSLFCSKICKREYLSSVFEFVPSELARLRCSNTLAYRFSSWRETAYSLKDTQHKNDVPVLWSLYMYFILYLQGGASLA